MYKFYLLLLINIGLLTTCKAVEYFDTLNTIGAKERMRVAENIYTKKIERADSTIALPALNKLFDIANQHDDDALKTLTIEMLGRYYDDLPIKYKPRAISYFLQAIDMAEKAHLKEMEAELNDRLGRLYYDYEKYPLAFECLIKACDIIKDIGYDNVHDVSRYLYDIGVTYYDFEDYDKAKLYLTEATQHPFPNLWVSVQTYNTLGLTYRQFGQYDKAIYYFEKAISVAREKNDSASIGFVIGNIGHIYYLQGEYEKALPLYRIDYVLSMKHKQWLSATKDLLTLADISFTKNHIDSAQILILEAQKLSHIYKTLQTSIEVYRGLYKLYHIKNDLPKAYIYLDSFIVYKDSLAKRNDTKMYGRIEMKLEMQKHQSELQLLESEKSKQIILRDALIIAFLLFTAIAIQGVFRQRLKHKKDHEIFLLEKQKNESEIKRAEEELNNAEQLLVSYVDSMQEKNQLIEQFRGEIKLLQSKPNNPIQIEKTETLEKLLSTTILTEDDWNKFKKLFEKAHKSFFIKLKMKYPDLTQAETRLLALTKLNLNTKEMAAMLGISPDSIRKSRYRLYKKLDLAEDNGLKDIVANL